MNRKATTASIVAAVLVASAVFVSTACAQPDNRVAACDGGDMQACNTLGIEASVAGRHSETVRYFKKVCDAGYAVGCSNLAEQYFDGTGVAQDRDEAYRLFSGACQAEIPSGCAGVCLLARDVVVLTDEQSQMCDQMFEMACEGGNSWMCEKGSLVASGPVGNGCSTGAEALGNAYVRSNYIYAMFYGSIEEYIADNRSHFSQGGDAIRCAETVAQGLMYGAGAAYDPTAYERTAAVNAQLGTLGISPGPQSPSPSQMLYAAAERVSWLASVLPAASHGDYAPLHTPQTEEQQLRMFAEQMLDQFINTDPYVREAIVQQEQLIRQAAEAEYQWLVSFARSQP